MKALALDLGLKRIGVAVFMQGILMPLTPIFRKNREQAASEVKALLQKYEIELLLVGVPMGGSSEDEMRRRAEHFVGLLDFDGKLSFVDESFSSKEASKLARTKPKDGKLDSLSAYLIAKDYLGL